MPKSAATESLNDNEIEAPEEPKFYTKLGQRLPTPSPGVADRVFYESMLKEKPKSDLALVWCIEHGVFNAEIAKKRYEEYEAAKQRLRAQSVTVSAVDLNKSSKSSSTTKKGTKRSRDAGKVIDPTATNVDAVGMSAGGDEGIGTTTIG